MSTIAPVCSASALPPTKPGGAPVFANTCPVGINGIQYPVCSNLTAMSQNGPMCRAQYDSASSAAKDAAIGDWCSRFASTSEITVPTAPYDCGCALRDQDPIYQRLLTVATERGDDVDFIFGNVGCWWAPCQNSVDNLIPSNVESNNCPSICANIVEISQTANINIAVNQSITCSTTNTNTSKSSRDVIISITAGVGILIIIIAIVVFFVV